MKFWKLTVLTSRHVVPHWLFGTRTLARCQTVSCHNFKSQNFKLSVSNPKSKHVAYLSVLSQISNCQGLGRKNKHEIWKLTGLVAVIMHTYCLYASEHTQTIVCLACQCDTYTCVYACIVYMYICVPCIHKCLYIYIYIYRERERHTHAHTYIYLYIYIYIHKYVFICIYIYIYMHTSVRIYVYIYIYIHNKYIHIYIYICIYIHTLYTHVSVRSRPRPGTRPGSRPRRERPGAIYVYIHIYIYIYIYIAMIYTIPGYISI